MMELPFYQLSRENLLSLYLINQKHILIEYYRHNSCIYYIVDLLVRLNRGFV